MKIVKDEKGESVMEMMENLDKLTGIKQTVDPEKERPISAGWYATEDGRTTSVAHWLEEDDFRNNVGS